MTERNALVVGAKPNSLGDWLSLHARARGWHVTTAGITEEDVKLDVLNDADVVDFFVKHPSFNTVICTAGINEPSTLEDDDFSWQFGRHMEINCVGPMKVLHYWLKTSQLTTMVDLPTFVAVSSNSAHIARTQSAPYCASKAALSMAIRTAAREWAHDRLSIWGVEPGYMPGTPMSQLTEEEFGSNHVHRIPGGRAPYPNDIAHFIVHNIDGAYEWLNGCMLRLDGGEQ